MIGICGLSFVLKCTSVALKCCAIRGFEVTLKVNNASEMDNLLCLDPGLTILFECSAMLTRDRMMSVNYHSKSIVTYLAFPCDQFSSFLQVDK